MSSACRCHTDEYCFYCEMYVPLERKCEGLLIERDKALDEIRYRNDKQRAAYLRTKSQLILAVKALEQIITESICKGEDCSFGETFYAVIANTALEEIKRISTEGVSQ